MNLSVLQSQLVKLEKNKCNVFKNRIYNLCAMVEGLYKLFIKASSSLHILNTNILPGKVWNTSSIVDVPNKCYQLDTASYQRSYICIYKIFDHTTRWSCSDDLVLLGLPWIEYIVLNDRRYYSTLHYSAPEHLY